MTDDMRKTISGTDKNDHISPEGHGFINTGMGSDTIVISEGNYFEIKGFEGTDVPFYSKERVETINSMRNFLNKEELNLGQDDNLLMFIEPEKEQSQTVKYFEKGDVTYVVLYDETDKEIVSGARVLSKDFNIKVVGENGSLGVQPQKIKNEDLIDELFYDVAINIAHGEVKAELKKDPNLTDRLNEYMHKKVLKSSDDWGRSHSPVTIKIEDTVKETIIDR